MKTKLLDEINQELKIDMSLDSKTDTDPTIKTEFPLIELKSLDKINREFMIDMLSTKDAQPLPIETEIIYTEPKAEIEFREISEQETVIPKNKNTESKKKRNIFGFVSDALFYLTIMTIMVVILNFGAKDGAPKIFMGYSYFTVLTQSMQDEIPAGSFILVKKTEPQKLQTGDNITFMRDANTTVTHKIINVYENYNDSGLTGFQTKGTNNEDPDKEIVYEGNIVGKVVFSVPKAGAMISYLRSNIFLVHLPLVISLHRSNASV